MPTSQPPVLAPALPALLPSWQRVQAVLHAHRPGAAATLDLAGLAVYHHCAYSAFAQPADARRAGELLQQLIPAGEQLLGSSTWSTQQFEQACALAWLRGRHAIGSTGPDMTALLTNFDQLLGQQVHQLSERGSQRTFTQAIRYLSLRLPTAAAAHHIQLLLARRAAAPPPEPWLLGLPDGLAGELLLQLRLQRLGLPDETLPHYLRVSITRLLATRREVDFSENHYSVFPYQTASLGASNLFSPALTWSRGDLSQALILYEAHQLLHDEELSKIADLVGLNTLLRITTPATEVVSSRFCSGAAGVAHLYCRLYQLSGQAGYKQGYNFWLDQTQQWLRQELASPAAVTQAGELLHGLAGVGLVLLAAVTATDFKWDYIVL